MNNNEEIYKYLLVYNQLPGELWIVVLNKLNKKSKKHFLEAYPIFYYLHNKIFEKNEVKNIGFVNQNLLINCSSFTNYNFMCKDDPIFYFDKIKNKTLYKPINIYKKIKPGLTELNFIIIDKNESSYVCKYKKNGSNGGSFDISNIDNINTLIEGKTTRIKSIHDVIEKL